jgi:formylglycine-generating enzyme required for sulfatase activity
MNRRFLAGMAVVMLAFVVGGCSIPGFRVKGSYVEDARCDLDMKMIYVKGGTFQMGATSEQGYDVDKDEKPVHTVTLESYYIAECEVTQAQWCKVMGTSIYQQHGKAATSWSMYGVDDDNPMYYVNWYEAQEFCRRLSQMTGKHYTLPTEAQWEYAARGGKKSKGYRYSGSNNIGDVAWYDNFSYGRTNPVKQKQPNELGLYDMSGNVWEWCSDWRRDDYYWSSPQNDPMGPSSGRGRVLRGGSWNSIAKRCRASYRGYYDPSNRDNNLGFRVVCLP